MAAAIGFFFFVWNIICHALIGSSCSGDWRPLLGFFMWYIICDALIGSSCSGDRPPAAAYLTAGSDDDVTQVHVSHGFLTLLVANVSEVGVSDHTLDVGCNTNPIKSHCSIHTTCSKQ